ncbi:ABC transporter permease [Paenibacillus segetis]|uniref:ABC transporter permease n=1 Tax=Paenibacillus segetis TaxID=1325360 RepID=A0ABQ1YGK7_9BACL|nr:ABC transporter permease [Paenibacillus segetis]GGH23772.1 hypothetical protein GCM10008013_23120 [Paenibacillus segetis]
MLEVLYCEWRKMRKSAAFGVTISLALLCPILFFLIKISDMDFKALKDRSLLNWTDYLENEKIISILIAGLLVIAIVSSYAWVREHGDNTLNVLFTYPVHRLTIITAKLILIALFLLGYNLIDTIISHVLIMIVKGEWIPGHNLIDNLMNGFISYLFQVALVPLFFLIGMISRNIIVPIATSIIFMFVLLYLVETSYLDSLPFGGPIFPFMWYDDSTSGLSMFQMIWENGILMVVCLAVIVYQTLRSEVR